MPQHQHPGRVPRFHAGQGDLPLSRRPKDLRTQQKRNRSRYALSSPSYGSAHARDDHRSPSRDANHHRSSPRKPAEDHRSSILTCLREFQPTVRDTRCLARHLRHRRPQARPREEPKMRGYDQFRRREHPTLTLRPLREGNLPEGYHPEEEHRYVLRPDAPLL